MIVANGGPKQQRFIMEAAGVNLEIVRTRYGWWFADMQIKFVEEYDSGTHPTSKLSAFAVSIMGDGVPFYITTLQNSL
jgi:hypothetical protein